MEEVSDEDIQIPVEFFQLSRSQLIIDKNDATQKAYTALSEARLSIGVIRFMALFFIPIMIYVFVMALLHAKSWYFIAAIAFTMLCIRNPIFVFYSYLRRKIKRGEISSLVHTWHPWIPLMGSSLTILSVLAPGLFLLARVLNGQCESLDQLHMYGCNSEAEVHALPQEHMLMLMIMPILMSTVFKSVRTRYNWFAWLLTIFFIALCIGIADAWLSIPALVAYIPFSACILYENHRQNIILFLVMRKQQRLLQENKNLAEEAQNELRFMIANMAHDLKTPLSSFMNGVETLSSLVTDLISTSRCETSVDMSSSSDPQKTKDLHSSIKDNIRNLFNVNNFMTMTVNRCIDYMKASKGIKLEPRYETINLQEVLSMPVNCMKDLQSRIAILQRPIPSNICSHIITDLQWLQENLFCLVSNAVKYSSQGEVTLTVSLTTCDASMITSAKKKIDLLRQSSGSEKKETAGGQEAYEFLDKLPAPAIKVAEWDSSHSSFSVRSHTKVYVEFDRVLEKVEKDLEKGLPPSRREIANAMRETAKQEAQAAEAKGQEGERLLLVEVEDTGIGLSDEVKESLFTPFKQAQRRAGGTGLGLYSLAKRVDALGGYYGVCNRRDGQQGSIFWFAIPYREDPLMSRIDAIRDGVRIETQRSLSQTERELKIRTDAMQSRWKEIKDTTHSPRASPKSPRSPKGSSKVGSMSLGSASTDVDTSLLATTPERKLRILLVDDSLPILKMTTNLLKRQGHVVDQEMNGADALARLEKNRSGGIVYDVMLMDLNMPVMDGLEAMKRLREIEKQLNVGSEQRIHQNVFAFSANSDHTTMLEAMEAGADDFISKPFSIQTFQDKCEKLASVVTASDAATTAAN